MRILSILIAALLWAAPAHAWQVVGSGIPAPTGGLTITDNFNRANQNPLRNGYNESATPTGTWMNVTGFASAYIYSNEIKIDTTNARMYLTATLADDQWAQCSTRSNNLGWPMVRASSSANTGYYLRIGGSILYLRKVVNGTVTDLDDWAITRTDTKVYKISVTGADITVSVDGVAQSPVFTDPDPIPSGYAGIDLGASYCNADNFAAGEN